jgi:4'-phosphopantetheinyl transferase EntD
VTAPPATGSAAPPIDDVLRRLLCRMGGVLDAAQRAAAPVRATLRHGAGAALALEHGAPDPAMLLPADLARASRFPSARRRDQFLLGRAAANRALAALRGPGAESVGRGPEGEPLWPSGFVGSISHTGTLAVSIVLRAGAGSVGIDVETMLPRDDAELAGYVLGPDERAMLASACRRDDHPFYVAFSVKEAVIKALLPLLGTFVDFREISLVGVRAEAPDGLACDWRRGSRGGVARCVVSGAAVCSLAAAAVGTGEPRVIPA